MLRPDPDRAGVQAFPARYLDLIADCDPPSPLGLETCLDRLGSAGYRTSWPAEETQAVDAFFDAFVEASLNQLLLVEWPVGPRLQFDMGEMLVMVVRAGGDLERTLRTFDRGADPQAAVHMASLRADVRLRDGRYRFEQAHLGDHRPEAERIGAFLMRDSVTERIEAAKALLGNPDYDGVLALGL